MSMRKEYAPGFPPGLTDTDSGNFEGGSRKAFPWCERPSALMPLSNIYSFRAPGAD